MTLFIIPCRSEPVEGMTTLLPSPGVPDFQILLCPEPDLETAKPAPDVPAINYSPSRNP